MKRVRLGQVLVEQGDIDSRQLQAALEWQKRRGGRIGNALLNLGLVGEEKLARALGRQLGVPVVDPTAQAIDRELLRLVPVKVIESRRVVPLALLSENRRGPLVVATADPLDLAVLDEIAFASGKAVRPVLASRMQIDVAIGRLLGKERPAAVELPPEPAKPMELVQPPRAQRLWN